MTGLTCERCCGRRQILEVDEGVPTGGTRDCPDCTGYWCNHCDDMTGHPSRKCPRHPGILDGDT